MPKFLTATRTVELLPKNTQISIKIVIFFFSLSADVNRGESDQIVLICHNDILV